MAEREESHYSYQSVLYAHREAVKKERSGRTRRATIASQHNGEWEYQETVAFNRLDVAMGWAISGTKHWSSPSQLREGMRRQLRKRW